MASWLGQYCLNVTDLDRTVSFFETVGLTCTSRTDISEANEAIVENPDKGSKLQLAQQAGQDGALDMGNAFWKLYVNTNDIDATHKAAVAAGYQSLMAPQRLDRWPISMAFVAAPDGYQVELVQRHPWTDGDDTTPAWLGQYCINVTDLDRAVARYEAFGLTCTSRTEIPDALEAIVENPEKGSKLQLAQQKAQQGPIDMGTAMWKLYVNTDDIGALYDQALAAGCTSVAEPERYDRWPVTVAFVSDDDGYLIELVQRHPW
jgi:predicted enzyme related to lactoylglutathione lyase